MIEKMPPSLGLPPVEIGKYIISECAERGRPVSNYKANLLLYFVWAGHYRRTGEALFTNEFAAMPGGPMFIPFFYLHAAWGGIPINRTYKTGLDYKIQNSVDEALDRYLPLSAGELCSMARKPGSPWSLVYNNGAGERDCIPFPLIIAHEDELKYGGERFKLFGRARRRATDADGKRKCSGEEMAGR